MTRWEYRVEIVAVAGAADALSRIGGEGWELAVAVPMPVKASHFSTEMVPGLWVIFKRPRPENAVEADRPAPAPERIDEPIPAGTIVRAQPAIAC